ncbi:hypothetical protein VCRA2121O439_300035 [Vibrio crassostreae]|nr:hypothetical protein VCRA2122O11_300036 [Vibrio crassostreae]CAK3873474.1 hypothetical protein VCRA2121O439_300035 [Vibrio crassostreae]CAK3879240.1 hypothetical protein VCRA2120E8_300036 [Vibrio crassostreae]
MVGRNPSKSWTGSFLPLHEPLIIRTKPPDGFFCDVFCWRRLTIDFLTANKVILYRAQFKWVRVLNKFAMTKCIKLKANLSLLCHFSLLFVCTSLYCITIAKSRRVLSQYS